MFTKLGRLCTAAITTTLALPLPSCSQLELENSSSSDFRLPRMPLEEGVPPRYEGQQSHNAPEPAASAGAKPTDTSPSASIVARNGSVDISEMSKVRVADVLNTGNCVRSSGSEFNDLRGPPSHLAGPSGRITEINGIQSGWWEFRPGEPAVWHSPNSLNAGQGIIGYPSRHEDNVQVGPNASTGVINADPSSTVRIGTTNIDD